MVLWTIYISTTEGAIKDFTIDNEQTFEEFRKLVSAKLGINYADLLLCGKQEYNSKYNSRKIY